MITLIITLIVEIKHNLLHSDITSLIMWGALTSIFVQNNPKGKDEKGQKGTKRDIKVPKIRRKF